MISSRTSSNKTFQDKSETLQLIKSSQGVIYGRSARMHHQETPSTQSNKEIKSKCSAWQYMIVYYIINLYLLAETSTSSLFGLNETFILKALG